MKIHKIELFGYDWAMQAMRQPYQSVGSDEKDTELSSRLILAGREHRKFLRQITIQTHLSASMVWWAEMDTYKVGTTRNSQSFWNSWKGEFVSDDFVLPGCDILTNPDDVGDIINATHYHQAIILWSLNQLASLNVPKETLRYLVPQGIAYSSILTMTGETYFNILSQRQNHRLEEWIDFIANSMSGLMQQNSRYYKMFRLAMDVDSKAMRKLLKV